MPGIGAARTAAWVGFGLSVVSVMASYAASVGATPAALYGETGWWIASYRRWSHVPMEMAGVALFGIMVLLLRRLPLDRRSVRVFFLFLVAAATLGLTVWFVMSRRPNVPPTLTVIGAALSALVIVILTSFEPTPSWRELWPARSERRSRSHRPMHWQFLVAVAVFVGGVAIIQGHAARVPQELAGERSFSRWFAARIGDRPASGVAVVVYTDYQCPACARHVPIVVATAREMAADASAGATVRPVTIEVRDFPLNESCNAAITGPFHLAACDAAIAARVVRSSLGDTAAEDFGTWMYSNHARLSPELIQEKLKEVGVADLFASKYKAVSDALKSEAAEGSRLGVLGTPAVFVNGVKLLAPESIRWAIAAELNRLPRKSHP